MTQIIETKRAKLMMFHGFSMLMLGMLLLYIRETMAFFYAYGCALAMLLIAASLILLAALDWICIVGQGAERASKLRGVLFISVGAAASGAVLALSPGATIKMFCYLIAFYALLLSFGKYKLARYWNGPEHIRIVMYVLAAVALLFGVLLLLMAGGDERNVITLLASYSLFMGAQMLLTIFYLHEEQESVLSRLDAKQTRL
jgi:hypothetical protein